MILNERKEDRLKAKNSRILLYIGLIITALFLITPVCGAPIEQLSGNQNIISPTIWKDRHIILTGNLIVTHGGTLILDNTILEMNSSYDYQYIIKVEANGLLRIINSSEVTSYYKSQIYGSTKSSRILAIESSLYPLERPNVQIEDSTISYMGTYLGATGMWDGEAVTLWKTGTETWIKRSILKNCIQGVTVMRSNAFANISDTLFKDIGANISGVQLNALVQYGPSNYLKGIKPVIANTTFDHVFNGLGGVGGTGATPIYISFANDVELRNVKLLNSMDSAYAIDIYNGERNFTFSDIYADKIQAFVMNINVQNVTAKNFIWKNSIGFVGGGGAQNGNSNFDNLKLTNVSNILKFQGSTSLNWTFTNVTLDNTAGRFSYRGVTEYPQFGITGKFSNSIFKNFDMKGSLTKMWIYLSNEMSSGQYSYNNTFENFTIYGSAPGYSGRAASVVIGDAYNNRFIDWDFINKGSGNDLLFSTGSTNNNKWINVKLNENKVAFADSIGTFDRYYYLDVLVKDSAGNPIPNAVVTITNTVNSAYPSINRTGAARTTFYSGTDGHTPLPLINDAGTSVIMDYLQTATSTQQMTYTITAEKNGVSATVTGVDPDATWYRPDPKVPGKTIVLTLGGTFPTPTPTATPTATPTPTVTPTPTATPTVTPTPTATPTATPIPTPNPDTINISYSSATPGIDGVLDEWTGASGVSFNDNSGRGAADNTANVKAMWNNQYLYFAFNVTDTNLQAVTTAREGTGLYLDDAIEIYIDRQHNAGPQMQTDDYNFMINMNNAVADAKGTGTGGRDFSWTSNFVSAVKMNGTSGINTDTDEGYIIEVAIPWSDIGGAPVSGDIIGLDLAVGDRDNATDGYQYFDWSNLVAFSNPASWKDGILTGNASFAIEDVNQDGSINQTDLDTIQNSINTNAPCQRCDVNTNGIVDIYDVTRVSVKV